MRIRFDETHHLFAGKMKIRVQVWNVSTIFRICFAWWQAKRNELDGLQGAGRMRPRDLNRGTAGLFECVGDL